MEGAELVQPTDRSLPGRQTNDYETQGRKRGEDLNPPVIVIDFRNMRIYPWEQETISNSVLSI